MIPISSERRPSFIGGRLSPEIPSFTLFSRFPYDIYQAKVADYDVRLKAVLDRLTAASDKPVGKLPRARHTTRLSLR